MGQTTQANYETHEDDDSPRFEDPVKVPWTGHARSRITEYNTEFDEENSGDGSALSPERFLLAMRRLKTKVVCVTPEEAGAVRYELTSYDHEHRTWMNASMGRSLDLVAERLDEQMADRGYTPVWAGMSFRGYFPEAEGKERQAEIDQRLSENKRRRQALKSKVGEIYSRVCEKVDEYDNQPNDYWSHDGAEIVFEDADASAHEVAARLLREAGCTNVTIESEECKDRRFMSDDYDTYVRTEVTGDMPEEEWLAE